MPTVGSITKTMRISPEDLGVIEGIMRDERVSWSGALHYLVEKAGTPKKENCAEGTPQNFKNRDSATAKLNQNPLLNLSMALGMEYGRFCKEIEGLIDNGGIMKEGSRLVAKENGVDLTDFFEVCHETGIDPQKAVNTMTNSLRKGK